MTKIFFDTKYTGKHKNTTLISIGLISECGKTFYAELTNYNKSQVDDWAMAGTIDKLKLQDKINEEKSVFYWRNDNIENLEVIAVANWMVANNLAAWLSEFNEVEFWGDNLSYSWVLFNSLFKEDKYIHHTPFDISTLLKIKGLDPKTDRYEFALGISHIDTFHERGNAAYDARIIKMCYDKLMEAPKKNIPAPVNSLERFEQMEIGEHIDFEDPRKGISFVTVVRKKGNIKTKSIKNGDKRTLRVWRIK